MENYDRGKFEGMANYVRLAIENKMFLLGNINPVSKVKVEINRQLLCDDEDPTQGIRVVAVIKGKNNYNFKLPDPKVLKDWNWMLFVNRERIGNEFTFIDNELKLTRHISYKTNALAYGTFEGSEFFFRLDFTIPVIHGRENLFYREVETFIKFLESFNSIPYKEYMKLDSDLERIKHIFDVNKLDKSNIIESEDCKDIGLGLTVTNNEDGFYLFDNF